MSQENVELVRRAFEAYAEGGIEALVQYATPDCVFYPDPSWMEEQEYRGRDAVVAFHKTQTDAFGDLTVEVHEIRPAGERVLVLADMVGQATSSGVPIRQQAGHVFSDFRDDMIGEDRTFLSWGAALKAVGLSEQAVSQEALEPNEQVATDTPEALPAASGSLPTATPV